jgi:hypothetical protein
VTPFVGTVYRHKLIDSKASDVVSSVLSIANAPKEDLLSEIEAARNRITLMQRPSEECSDTKQTTKELKEYMDSTMKMQGLDATFYTQALRNKITFLEGYLRSNLV